MKKFRVGFKEVEYGWVEVSAYNEDNAKEIVDDIISRGNANYGKSEREIDQPIEIDKFEKEIGGGTK